MSLAGYDLTQATLSTTWGLTDTLLVVEDQAIYRITGTFLQSLVNATLNPTEKLATKTGTYTLASGDGIINADTDTAGADIAINLGAASEYWDATNLRTQVITVKNTGATDDAVVTPASGTIDGAASIVIGPGASAEVYTDGSNFFARGL